MSQIPICWDPKQVSKAIATTANVHADARHYFLACHAPMVEIQDVQKKKSITDVGIFQQLKKSIGSSNQTIIYGEPGTGKSHLIYWLQLMFDQAVESGEVDDLQTVLIKRRDGSLKDALTQVIEQLGEDFEHYLSDVVTAIDNISEVTARQQLAQNLSTELGPKWKDRGRNPIENRLRSLSQACRTEGFMKWLVRDGGVIDRRIKLLVDPSEMEQRDNADEFTEQDLLLEEKYKRREELTDDVEDLILELEDDEQLRARAAELLNIVLKDAIGGMIGLDGANLSKIFNNIRKDLKGKKALALFVEDVSVMSELDVNVVTALEPNPDPELCPLTAVIGMTKKNYEGGAIREGQQDRITFRYRMDGKTTEKWASNSEGLSAFVARYFNAIRLKEKEVKEIAQSRQSPGVDVTISKCDTCEVRDLCHQTFGCVTVGDAKIGTYPFSGNTTRKMLPFLGKVTQRRLLLDAVKPIMEATNSFEEKQFPDANVFPVQVSDPPYWTDFQNKYLGNYTPENRERVKVLAVLWIATPQDEETAAAEIEPFLSPLGLPKFSQAAPDKKPHPPVTDPGSSPKPPPVDDRSTNQVTEHLDALSGWLSGGLLKKENFFRDLLSKLVTKSIAWELFNQPAQFVVPTWNIVKGRSFIHIEGQPASPDKALHYTFERNKETRSLLEALMRQDKEGEGKGSWDFKSGQLHQRTVARWVRKNQRSIVEALTPSVDVEQATTAVIQCLALCAIIGGKSRLPVHSFGELVDRIFSDVWEHTPGAISKPYQKVLDELEVRHQQMRDYLLRELAVRQGTDKRKVNFIQPLRIIEVLKDFRTTPKVDDLPAEFYTSFWKARFAGLETKTFQDLHDAVAQERKAIEVKLSQISKMFDDLEYTGDSWKENYDQFCQEIVELDGKTKAAKIIYPDEEFRQHIKSNAYEGESRIKLGAWLASASRVIDSEDPMDVFTFESTDFEQLETLLRDGQRRYQTLEGLVEEQEGSFGGDDDPEVARSKFLDALKQLAEFGGESEGADDVENS